MKVLYKKILNKSKLILSDFDADNFSENYLIKMITNNSISGLISTELDMINCEPILSYDITSKHSLMSVLENRKIDFSLFFTIMTGIHNLCTTLDNFMLDNCYLLLSPEYIFFDGNMQLLYFCYCPICETNHIYSFTDEIKHLLEYFISKLNYDDKNCVAHVYSLHQKCVEDTFCLNDLISITGISSSDSICNIADTYRDIPDIRLNKISDTSFNNIESNLYENHTFENDIPSSDESFNTKNSEDIFISNNDLSYICGFPIHYFFIITGLSFFAIFTIVFGIYMYFIKKAVSFTMFCVISLFGPVILLMILPSLIKRRRKNTPHVSSFSSTGNFTEPGHSPAFDECSSLNCILNTSNSPSSIMPIGETVLITPDRSVSTPYLIYTGNDSNEDIKLTAFPFTIGKLNDSSDYIFDNTVISRIHARFYKKEDCYYVEDLNSSNGTYLNNVPLSPHTMSEIHDGDYITFACLTYIFKLC